MRLSTPSTVEAINQMLASSARCYRWPLPTHSDGGELHDKFMAYRRIGEYMATGKTVSKVEKSVIVQQPKSIIIAH